MARYSRQREAIRKQVSNRKDHPTAETLYAELKPDYPEMSLATVYRNLGQLVEWGDIIRIDAHGAARYDWVVEPHSHFFCRECGCVVDMPEADDSTLQDIRERFDGTIEAVASNYFGLCKECEEKLRKAIES
ncbi:MAG: transcriptional repressor [Mogibacterium sp.]|nr:transcriptional repressor [Mogibacterium sp.]